MTRGPLPDDLWQLVMSRSPVGMTIADAAGDLVLVNDAFCRMLGRSHDDLVSTNYVTFTHPDDLADSQAQFARVADGGLDDYRLRKRYVRADGTDVWVDLSVALVRDGDGRPEYVFSQVVDVTAQHDDQLALARATARAEHERLVGDAILDTVDVGLTLLDGDGAIERMNDRYRAFLALAHPDGDLTSTDPGLTFAADGTTPLSVAGLPSVRAIAGEEFDDYRIWVGDDPLTRRAVSVSARSVRDSEGRPVARALAMVDITVLLTALHLQANFANTVSHELRTPLTSIVGHLEMVAEGEVDLPEALTKPLAVVRRNAHRLLHLVGDILDENHLRTGSVALDRQDVDIDALVAEAIESAGPAATQHCLTIEADLAGTDRCFVDAERLRRVLDNLIGNAIKYSDDGGRITVSCEQRLARGHRTVLITVADDGIGIDRDDLARIRSPFFRGQQARARHSPGLGLGLGIVDAIVRAHGGLLHIDSAPGTGTRARVEVPADPLGRPAADGVGG
ncbi:ATP-binding protein [Nocardioides sp. C4-1]|uniref:sensor histidine kinase n=1 Tax=Nocardioides sp. C4-1 TaxID=3151851 RepID=UPI0032644B41